MGDIAEKSPQPAPNPMPDIETTYAHQAEKLSLEAKDLHGGLAGAAIKANFITPQDPVVVTRDGGRLPAIPREEAEKLNKLRSEIEKSPGKAIDEAPPLEESKERPASESKNDIKQVTEGQFLQKTITTPHSNPLFPPLPLYGPPSILRNVQCLVFRATSFVISCTFLGVIVVCAAGSAVPRIMHHVWLLGTFRNPAASRPFYEDEKRNRAARKAEAKAWKRKRGRRNSTTRLDNDNESEAVYGDFIPTEGGTDPIICDVGYYARRVGLDMEEFQVQTEDGFIIKLWHIYNPLEHTPLSEEQRGPRGPEAFTNRPPSRERPSNRKPKYPVLMIHGLLQSAGAYCVLDDNSLAFYLCKAGYDVWLGNNRCGFEPDHTMLSYNDPRMWSWNIRQMGVMDLPALTSRVLAETGFQKLGFVGHSQGTTQAFVAFAKDQRPELGDKISVFCALAPAAYSGPLLNRFYFKFIKRLSPAMYRICFGIHAFIPFMMRMHKYLPSRLYGLAGYYVFNYLFGWSDMRWDRGVRDRCFKFAPVYISAESMRWWLGRDSFAKQTCILSTREECNAEDAEDLHLSSNAKPENDKFDGERPPPVEGQQKPHSQKKVSNPWYDTRSPPMALWIPGSDLLVDGRKLLDRFQRREPHARLVHYKIIQEYEHLDVIWAMDNIEKVGSEVKEVLWKTCGVRDEVRVPKGCESIEKWVDDRRVKVEADVD